MIILPIIVFLLSATCFSSHIILNLEKIYKQKPIKSHSKLRLLDESFNNSLSLSNIFNIHYNIKLYIGNPLKEFRLILDTGSNWLWVGTDSCDNCYQIGIGDLYNCSNSISCIEEKDNKKEILYGIGYVSGYVTKDVVSFDKEMNLSVSGQEFLQIEKIEDIDQLRGEGILGIGKKGYDTSNYLTFIQTLKSQNKIERNMYSLYLLGHECKEDSKIVIGGYDENLFEGNISYIKVISDDFWNIPIESVYFTDNGNKQNIDSVYKTALIDSGSSEIVMNSEDLKAIISYFKNLEIICELVNNHQEVPQLTCEESDLNKYPDFNILINGTVFVIKANDYMANCYFRYFKYLCRLHFVVDNTLYAEQIIILGETFLNNYYSIYDIENNRIGLAKAKKTIENNGFSIKGSLLKIFALIVISNMILFILQYLCVKLKVCAKIEGLNFVEKIFRNFKLYPDVLTEDLNEKNEI